ncbi:MAG: hypothetical protein P4N41_13255 [Negativicutes bacterium]|nr:hypothetical protein [Negativicutes bacterium]
MKEVRKKSADPAVNQMIVKAYRQQVDLAWDRAEAMQPQCGFGRLAICCTDCFEGPCRVNPFADEAQRTTCGRDQAALIASHFIRRTADGAGALVKLAAEFGGDIGYKTWQKVTASDDAMFIANYDRRLRELGEVAVTALAAIGKAKTAVYGQTQPDVSAVNMGVLNGEGANIVLHGHVPPQAVQELATAAGAAGVQVVALCGSELSGAMNIPVLTNYDSQETPLLTGAVDLLVLGGQCVMPAMVALADKLGIPVMNAADLKQADAAVAVAVAAFKRRAGKKTDIPAVKEELYVGYTADNSPALFEAVAKAHRRGVLRGVVYMGGCGNMSSTQDAELVKTAAGLINNGYLIVTSGCAGTALAKAGLCHPDHAGAAGIKSAVSADVPPVIYLGSCHDAGEFAAIAKIVSAYGVPVAAVLPELVHNKTLATIIGFASLGIATFVGMGEIALPGGLLGGRVQTFAEFQELPQALAAVAAAK